MTPKADPTSASPRPSRLTTLLASRFFYGWVVVGVAAFLGFLGTGFYSYSRGMFLPSLAEDIAEGSRFAIAMGFSAAGLISALVAPGIGTMLDRRSPRLILLFGIAVVTVSYIGLSQVTSLPGYYLAVGLGMGLGMACMGGLAWHRTVISWFDHWRGRAIAIAVMGASLSGVMMPPLVTVLVESLGWRVGYLTFAVITAVALAPMVYFLMRDRPEEVGEVRDGRAYVEKHADRIVEIEEDARAWTWREMLKDQAFWSIGLVFGAMSCVYSAVMLHLFGHLIDIGVEAQYSALVLSVTAAFAFGGKPIVGWLSDMFGAKVSIWLALVCQAGALLLFAFADGLVLATAAASLYGFGYSGMSPLRTFALSTAIGSVSLAKATGVNRIIEQPLALSASPLAGLIYDTTGSYQLAFLILAGLMMAACVGPLFMKAGGARERERRRIAMTSENSTDSAGAAPKRPVD